MIVDIVLTIFIMALIVAVISLVISMRKSGRERKLQHEEEVRREERMVTLRVPDLRKNSPEVIGEYLDEIEYGKLEHMNILRGLSEFAYQHETEIDPKIFVMVKDKYDDMIRLLNKD